MKLREYAKTRRVMQQDVEMRTMTTTGGVNGLTPETCATDLARSYLLPEIARRRGRDRRVKRARVVVRLATDRRTALGPDLVVLVAAPEDEQQLLAHRRRAPAARTEEARRLQLLDVVGHDHRRPILA